MLRAIPGNGNDPYGLFSRNCPNGSGHSIQLGNNTGGHEAEGISYTFTIPPGQDQFSLIYNYAVVFQDPGHLDEEQPRLSIEVFNVTDNNQSVCSSFEFIAKSSLPGFFQSTVDPSVWYKGWSANSVDLNGLAGKTIRLFFKTADCVFTAHFGYAYIDVNAECSSSFVGATYCPDDAFINVTAPYGYQTYEWWNSTFTTVLGNAQTINFTPPPAAGTQIAVILEPYSGYGCRDTLYAELLDTLTIQSVAGPDRLSCQNAPVQLGAPPRPTYVYSWSPVTGLSDPNIANPIATPSVTTEYIVSTTSAGGGCLTTDTVIVKAAVLDANVNVSGPLVGCILPSNPTILKVNGADSVQWYRNNIAIPGATDTFYNVVQTGTYHATVFSFVGCSLTSADVVITVNPIPLAGFTTNNQDQCFNNHQFIFTDTSSVAFGTMSYTWNMGDATPLLNSQNVTYSYAVPGTYTIKQLVTSDQGCIDSAFYIVNVYDSPVAGFDADIKGTCFKNNQFVFTNSSTLAAGTMQYNWNLGDGNIETTTDVTHSYLLPGTYTVRLTTTTDKGCPDDSAFDVTVNPDPVVGFSVADPQQCFGNNQFNFINSSSILTGTMQYLWTLGDGTSATTRDVTHSYTQSGDYTAKMVVLSDKGCTDSTSTNVKIFKYPVADFYVEPTCINLRLLLFNKTINNTNSVINYLWDFGNGQTAAVQNPLYSYPAPGIYPVKLSISTVQCPLTITEKTANIVIDAPAPALRYPDKDFVMNFKEPLQARQIGNSVLWTPATSLDFSRSYQPNFKGLDPQLYAIQLKTPTGCITVDTQLVKTHKKVDIYVATSFTPNGDGLNDYLRPFLLSFKSVNYFRVYNRWGKLLFQMQSDLPGWDGRVNGVIQEMQTVVWEVEAVDVDGIVHKKQGTSILIR
ncbi:MAG: PKD domain-containing protein [Ferruginibacter sp.]